MKIWKFGNAADSEFKRKTGQKKSDIPKSDIRHKLTRISYCNPIYLCCPNYIYQTLKHSAAMAGLGEGNNENYEVWRYLGR